MSPRKRNPDAHGYSAELPRFTVTEVAESVDFAIITIREDEFESLFVHFPIHGLVEGRRHYNLSHVKLSTGETYRVAMMRCAEQGGGEAQAAAHDILSELKPRFLLVTGIAGGYPSSEFSLGDVVVCTRIHDFTLEAVLEHGEREYNVTGGPLHPQASAIAANLPARKHDMSGWNSPNAIRCKRPLIHMAEDRFEGSGDWRKRVKDSLSFHRNRKEPLATACAIASSDRLVRDPDLLKVWQKIARHACAVEMESAGVYRAAQGEKIPFLAIRGISDVVGFKRTPGWTKYACSSAASFTYFFLRTRPILVRASDGSCDFERPRLETSFPHVIALSNRLKGRNDES